MFENYAFVLSLLLLSWLVGHSLNLLFEGVCDNSFGSNLKEFDSDFNRMLGIADADDSSSVIPSAVRKTWSVLKTNEDPYNCPRLSEPDPPTPVRDRPHCAPMRPHHWR